MGITRKKFLTNSLAVACSLYGGQIFSRAVNKMDHRTIPGKKETLPVIGMGTWQTFDVDSIDKIRELVIKFSELGGRVLDSSPMYGKAEKVTGLVTKDSREKYFLATKVWITGKDQGLKQIENSFRLMQTEVIDLLQIHNLLDWKTQIQTLRKLKDQGRIRYTGITHYLPSAFGEMEKIMKTEEIDFIQIPYSAVVRDADKRILPLAEEKKIGVLVNRPFEGGDLFRKLRTVPVPDELAEYGSWAQIMLKFVIAHNAVTCVIPATSSIKHLLENMGAGSGVLPDTSVRDRISSYIKKAGY